MTAPDDLGKLIKELRERRGYSQRQVSYLSGVSNTEIKRIEDGARKRPSQEVLQKLAKPLGISYEKLLRAAGYYIPGDVYDDEPQFIKEAPEHPQPRNAEFSLKTLASEIDRLCKERGLSPKDLAKRADVGEAYVASVIKGREKKPSPEVLRRLSDALGVPYATFARLAGYIMKAEDTPENKDGLDAFWFRGEGLTEDDMADILAIIESKERRRKKN
jgi:transcriptional regulator with XRE-family HTH domain